MSEAAVKVWTLDAFPAWEARAERRHKFVEGQSWFERRISTGLRNTSHRFIAQEDVADANASIGLRPLTISSPLSEIYDGNEWSENEAHSV